MILRRIGFVLALALSLVIFGCGGGDEAPVTPGNTAVPMPSGVGGESEGALIVARYEGLMEYVIQEAEYRELIPLQEPNSFLMDPDLSPDGSRIAYIRQPPPKITDDRYDAGSDLWVADRDGGNARAVYVHEQPNQIVRFPRWLDNETLFAIIQEIVTDAGVTSVVYALQRIDVATGEREIVLEDVLAYDLSPDRTRIAYAKLTLNVGETFEAVDVDGVGNPQTLVPISENLAPFNSPRFSPDGETIAFASADQTIASLGDRFASLAPAGAGSAALDGLPQDIWIVPADGGRPQLVADLKEDLPTVAWAGDKDLLYVLGALGMYEVNLTNGAVNRLNDGVFHGQITWAARS